MKYIPSIQTVAQQVVITLVAMAVIKVLISKFPNLQNYLE